MTGIPTPTQAALTADERRTIVGDTADIVRRHYVFPDIAQRLADLLVSNASAGGYAAASDPAALARAVTTDLQSLNGDKHLRLKHHEAEVVDEVDEAAWLASYTRDAERDAFGIRQVRQLGNGVAYLDLFPVLYHPAVAGDAIAAAMRLVSPAASLVIDLRECRGGSPETVALICSYLFDDETHLTDQLTNDPDDLHQRWTLPWVPGPRLAADASVHVLTSAATFSGGEDLAYSLQQAGRATVVGERTGGGAHPRQGFKVHPHLEVTVPVAYSRNSVSKTNWEGVGVVPDVSATAADALTVALGQVQSAT